MDHPFFRHIWVVLYTQQRERRRDAYKTTQAHKTNFYELLLR